MAYGYIQALTVNLTWKNTHGRSVEFGSSLQPLPLIRLYIGNIVAVACTAGLLIPWAVVRTLRYRLDNMNVVVDHDFMPLASPALPPVGATGQEVGDMFNLDLGI
jgi:uncharacterized membrane protein YjgN (DUF898 family)